MKQDQDDRGTTVQRQIEAGLAPHFDDLRLVRVVVASALTLSQRTFCHPDLASHPGETVK